LEGEIGEMRKDLDDLREKLI